MDDLDDTAWVLELESALDEEEWGGVPLDQRRIRQICKLRVIPDHLRSQVWRVCLGLEDKQNNDNTWNEMYDLPEQNLIRQDCQKLVEKLGNEEAEKLSVLCDIESVVTRFVKCSQLRYESGNGWMAILEPLVALRLLNKNDLYTAFYCIIHRYVPRSCYLSHDLRLGSASFHLLRLLLQYHDPEICSLLDSRKIGVDTFAHRWFASLFSESCDLAVTQAIWDIYLQICDPFLIFYLALVLLVNLRDQILSSRSEVREKVIELISSAPCALNADDVEDFCQLAHFYSTKTPPSVYTMLQHTLFGLRLHALPNGSLANRPAVINGSLQNSSSLPSLKPHDAPYENCSLATTTATVTVADSVSQPHFKSSSSDTEMTSDEGMTRSLAQVLCLPIPPADLLLLSDSQRVNALPYKSLVRFFVVDCRPAEQYNAGHLKTAFHLDASLMLSEPTAYSIAVQALFVAQRHMVEAGAAGEHICFMGSGREEEDKYVNMVVASFLQKQVTYISQVRGGYAALHELIREESSLEEHLAEHNPQQCIQCSSHASWHDLAIEERISSGNGVSPGHESDSSKVKANGTTSFFSRFRRNQGLLGRLKTSAYDWKEDLKGFMKSSPSSHDGKSLNPERHVSSGDRLGRRYRAADSMFTSTSLEDDDFLDDGSMGYDSSGLEEVSVEAWKHKPDVLAYYECEELRPGCKTLCPNCHLIISSTHLFVLRELSSKKNYAHIVARRPLVSIVKIMSKKSHPELITFKYGYCPSVIDKADENDQGECTVSPRRTFQITGSDVLFIPKAADAIKLVKMQVMKLLDEIENAK